MIIKYKKNNTTDVKLRILNNYEITKSSQEISYSDLTCDFTNHSVNDLPEKYQEVKLVEENGQVEPIWGNSTETGTIIEHNIEKEGLIKSYDIKGNTYQQTYTGKNLLNCSYTQTSNGIVSTYNSNGTLSFSGTPTSTWANITQRTSMNLPAGTYTLSIQEPISTGFVVRLYHDNSNYTDIGFGAGTKKITRTLNSAVVSGYIWIHTMTVGQAVNITGIKAQLESGSNATSWEKFVGGTASPNPDFPQSIENVTGLQTIEVVGKNLFNIQTVVKGRLDNGVIGYTSNTTNLSLNNNSFSFTTDANYRGVTSDYICVNNTEYMLHCTLPSNLYLTIACYNSSKTYLRDANFSYISGHNNQVKITLQNDVSYIRINFYLPQAGTITIENPQLEKGSTATEYEEYKGQKYEINLGKNLFDKDTMTWIRNNSDNPNVKDDSNTSRIRTNTLLKLDGGKTYTLSGIPSEVQSTPYVKFYASATSTSKTSGVSNSTFTVPTNATYVIFQFSGENFTEETKTLMKNANIQLEVGSQATSYSEYFTPIELNKIGDYQDRIYKQNNKWYIEKKIGKVVLDGTENWAPSGALVNEGVKAYVIVGLGTQINALNETNGYSNYFIVISGDNDWGTTEHKNSGYCRFAVNNFYIRISESLANNIENLKTWLGNNNVEIDYVLNEPEITEITNTDLIEQLNALIDKELNKGLNYIILNSDGELKVTIKEITGEIVNDKTLFYGYVDSYNFNEMREIDKYTEMNLTLLSPMKMATLRTFSSIGTYRLKTFIQNVILQPLLNDGFVLKKLNIIDRKITVNFLSKTIEYGLNELSNDYNLWWYIDENKNIYIIDIGILLKSEPKLTYDNTHKLNGLQYIKPRIYSDNYANVINFSNVRVYEYSNWIYDTDHVSVNVNGLINSQITPIKNNGVLDFKYPVDIKKENIIKSAEDNNVSPYGDYYGLQITGKYSDNTTFELYIKYNPTNGTYTMSNNIGFDGDEESTKPFLLVRDSFFSNLIVGLKYNNESKNISSITTIRSDSALIYNIYRFFNDKAIHDKKGIINDTGIVELTINMNEQWKTKSELQNIGISYINKNSLKLDGEIELKLDKNIVKVGDTIKINKLLFNDVYIVTKIQEQFNKGVFEYIVTLKNSNITENYIDLFRASQVQNEEDKIYKINIAHYSEEGIKETFEVVQ